METKIPFDLVGATYDDDAGANSGSAYFFRSDIELDLDFDNDGVYDAGAKIAYGCFIFGSIEQNFCA